MQESDSKQTLWSGFAVSRDGAIFVFFLVALGMAAVYSGKGGLMLLFCCLLAAVAILTAVARVNCTQGIVVERRFVEDFFANRDAAVDVLVTNHGRMPMYGIHVYERFEGGRIIGPMFFRRIRPGETASARYLCQFHERGKARFCGFEVRSRFPLPFFEWRWRVGGGVDAFVYPEPVPGHDEIRLAEIRSDSRGRHIKKEDTAIRELVNGRRSGRILWKLSAKRGTWLESVPVAPNAGSVRPVVQLVSRQVLSPERYELQVSQITYFVLEQIRSGVPGEVLVGGLSMPYGEAPADRRQVLEMLAMV